MKLLKAPLYAVSDEWEHNGYDDSDFYRTMYDPNTDEIKKVETRSTRYGCGYFAVVTKEYAHKHGLYGYVNHAYNPVTRQYDLENGIQVSLPVQWFVFPKDTPEQVWNRAEQLLAEHIYQLIRNAELRDVFEPQDAKFGTVLRLTEAHTHKDKTTGAKTTVAAGTVGEVFWCGAFGTFYRNDYNHPNRDNRRVGLRLLDGSKVFVPLKKCRLHKEPMTDSELRQRAEELAKHRRFEQCWSKVY